MEEHDMSNLSADDLRNLVEMGQEPLQRMRPEDCPFCDAYVSEGQWYDEKGETWIGAREFQHHVAEHLERLAVSSIREHLHLMAEKEVAKELMSVKRAGSVETSRIHPKEGRPSKPDTTEITQGVVAPKYTSYDSDDDTIESAEAPGESKSSYPLNRVHSAPTSSKLTGRPVTTLWNCVRRRYPSSIPFVLMPFCSLSLTFGKD